MSRVVVVKVPTGPSGSGLSQERYRSLLTVALRLLAECGEASTALRQYLPAGPVGMKTNCLARKANSTPRALTDALIELLVAADHAPRDLVVWERSSRELASAGYTLNASGTGVRCVGTDANGVGYSQGLYSSGEVNSLVSRVLTEQVAANINLPVLKDHSIAGLSASLKNMYGAVHNPNKYHGNNCDPYCAHVNDLAPIKSRNKLTLLDAVRVQYQGGPGYMPDYVAPFGAVVLSDDPVAADRVGLEIVERLRKDHGLPSLQEAGRPARYLSTAQELGLGTASWSLIDLQIRMVDAAGHSEPAELF